MATYFNVIINPFKQKMCVYARVKKVACETIIPYGELDDWNAFEFNGIVYDIHILYDDDINVSIYEVTNGETADYQSPSPVKLTIRTKDEF
jgi:hypothetical protein